MKILTAEEVAEHKQHVLVENIKGCVVGGAVAWGMMALFKRRYPMKYSQLNTSVKAAMWAMPTITVGAFYADDGSVKYDEDKYQSEYKAKVAAEKQAMYNSLSQSEKILHNLDENKYAIIVSAWAASLYGSWKLVDRDIYMTRAQKLVQARVYAQAITVVLLLSTIVLSMQEAKIKKKQPAPVPEWKRYLAEQEEMKNNDS
jgi:hypothetical protein